MIKTEKSSRERRKERTRAMLLQTAEQLLSEGGLQKLTLTELARQADYSKPAIYEYFGSFEDLLIDLNNSGYFRMGQRVQEVPDSLPPDERMMAIAKAILQFAAENVELYQLMFNHIIFATGNFDRNWEEAKEQNLTTYRVASQVIQEGIEQGIFKVRPGFGHQAMFYLTWVTIHGIASLKSSMVSNLGLEFPDNHDLVLTFLINNLKGLPNA